MEVKNVQKTRSVRAGYTPRPTAPQDCSSNHLIARTLDFSPEVKDTLSKEVIGGAGDLGVQPPQHVV